MTTSVTANSIIDASRSCITLRWLILGYFLILCCITPFNLLAFDTYYYWDWSRHLDFSYYDGPPLIAYLIRLVTFLCGHTVWGLACFSVLSTAMTTRMLYKTAALFLNEKSSYWVILLWLSSPLVTQDLLIQVTYDTPMTFFWTCSLYIAMRFMQNHRASALYGLAVSLGFLLLSKYTGIVLILGLCLFVLLTSYIRIFKTPHFYGALLLTSILFSPVILWNIHHHWVSFDYQMHAHQALETQHGFSLWLQTCLTKILPALNVMLLVPFFILFTKKQNKPIPDLIRFLLIVSLTFLGVYLVLAWQTNLRTNWLTQYWLMAALLSGWLLENTFIFYQTLKWRRVLSIYVGTNICVSFLILFNACLHFIPSKNYIDYQLIQQFNLDYPAQPSTVFASGWLDARVLFFLKNKPFIYTLNCGQAQNAYQLWPVPDQFDKQHILAVNLYDNRSCLLQHFAHCERVPTTQITGRSLFVYRCQTKIPTKN